MSSHSPIGLTEQVVVGLSNDSNFGSNKSQGGCKLVIFNRD